MKKLLIKTIIKRTALAVLAGCGLTAGAAELLYQEGFNTDGEAANPKRYTTQGRGVHETGAISGQEGPVYWAHNFEVSFVGVPGQTKGRRMLFAWDPAIETSDTTEPMLKLFDSSVKWLLNNKANARIILYPAGASIGALRDRLVASGYTIVDDDANVAETNLHTIGDLIIHVSSGANASRGVNATIPMISMSSPDHDDLLTSSIGTVVNFEATQGRIVATNHPAAGGATGTFQVATGARNWNLMGDLLPQGATTLATMSRTVTPTVASLDDVMAMAAGTKASRRATNNFPSLDFNDGSPGDWQWDQTIPGDLTGVWGLQATGKLNVTTAGTYSFAVASDDGARFIIDLNRNGLNTNDTVLLDAGPQGFTRRFVNVTFPQTGLYDFELVSYNSGGQGGVEVSVSKTVGGGKTNLLDNPADWETLANQGGTSPVKIQGEVQTIGFAAAGDPVEQTVPLIVLLNGPNDNPPGRVFGGGPFVGFEGTGFFAMSGGNKFAFPEGLDYRSVTLPAINVRGKTNLQVTIALAATFLDFETDDFLDLIAYPQGAGSTPVRLFRYSAPNSTTKYFVDVDNGNTNRLGLEFKDVTYAVPAGATDLVLELRARTTWWNEIVAFDNLRVTAGATESTPMRVTATRSGQFIDLSWTGGEGPFLVQRVANLGDTNWLDVATTSDRNFRGVIVPQSGFFRIQERTTKNIRHFHALLTPGAERPNPVTNSPAQGIGTISVDMNAKTAHYTVHYQGLLQAASMAHIHGEADTNSAAGIQIHLTPVGGMGTGGFFGGAGVALSDAHLNSIVNGRSYFNIHSGAHGGGEIRGQILPTP